MKLRTLLLCLIILSAQTAVAQLVVSNPRGYFFYLGIENPIDYAVKNINMDLVELKTSSGELLTDEDGLFWRSCDDKPGKVILSAYNKQTKKLIGEAEFAIRYLKDPIIAFEPDTLDNYVALGSYPPEGQDWDYPCRLRRYDLTFKKSNTQQIFTQEGNEFNDEVRKLVQSIAEGDTVTVSNIILKCGCIPADRKMSTPLIFVRKSCSAPKGCLKLVP